MSARWGGSRMAADMFVALSCGRWLPNAALG